MRLEVLLAAAESAVALGRMAEALGLAACAAQIEPSSERAVRVVMRAYGALGEIEKALSAYDVLRAELADSYGVDPAPQTRALHVELLVGTSSDGTDPCPESLVGRDGAVEEMLKALTCPEGAEPDATGGVVWLVGERGSGRTAVLRAACARAGLSMRQTRVRVERIARQQGPGRPLHADEVVVTPEASRLTSQDVLQLRDWAVSHGIKLVVPTSPHNISSLRAAYSSLGGPQWVTIQPLTPSDVEAFLRTLLQGTPAPSLVDAAIARTGGRPAELRATVSAWLRDGMVQWAPEGLTLDDGQSSVPLFPAPAVRLLRSLGTLDFRAVEALAVVAVIGGPVVARDVETVLAAQNRPHATDAHHLLALLADSGLLRLTASGYHMRCNRDTGELLAWLRPAERRRLHGVVALELALHPAERVRHLMASGQHELACEVGMEALALHHHTDIDDADELLTMLEALPTRAVPTLFRERETRHVVEPVGLLASA
jgi:hypothetical protein